MKKDTKKAFLKLLRKLEWNQWKICSICGGREEDQNVFDNGHKENCELYEVIHCLDCEMIPSGDY